jgi:hypothetical protein
VNQARRNSLNASIITSLVEDMSKRFLMILVRMTAIYNSILLRVLTTFITIDVWLK